MGGVVKSIKKAVGSITGGLLGSDDSAKAAKKIAEAQKQAAAAIAQAQEQAANIQRNFAQDLQLENIAQIVPGQEQTATVSDVKKRRRPQIGLASQLGLDL
jgi:hypothetical protein